MFNSNSVKTELKHLIGWHQHYDTNEIQISSDLTKTDSGEYYQDLHPAMRLDLISAILPDNRELDEYLETKIDSAITTMLNDVIQYRQLKRYGKTLLQTSQLLNRTYWSNDAITNEGKFVGLQIRLNNVLGLQILLNQIGFQFSDAESFKLYLFHTSKKTAIKTWDIDLTGSKQWEWKKVSEQLNEKQFENYNEGAFLLGYYQNDITGNALKYANFDFDKGVCSTCKKGFYEIWKNIEKYTLIYPFYFNSGDFVVNELPEMDKINYDNLNNYGLNLRLSVNCDLTTFFIENKMIFKNLLKLKMVEMVLKDIQYSQQTNYIEENIKIQIFNDLEGNVDTKRPNISTQYAKELQAVNFNMEGINKECLDCDDANTPEYGVI